MFIFVAPIEYESKNHFSKPGSMIIGRFSLLMIHYKTFSSSIFCLTNLELLLQDCSSCKVLQCSRLFECYHSISDSKVWMKPLQFSNHYEKENPFAFFFDSTSRIKELGGKLIKMSKMSLSKKALSGRLQKKTLLLTKKSTIARLQVKNPKLGCRDISEIFKIFKTSAVTIIKIEGNEWLRLLKSLKDFMLPVGGLSHLKWVMGFEKRQLR